MGPDNPNNLLNLLLDWITTEGNYARFRGNKEGKTKLTICKEVVSLLSEKGVLVQRSKKIFLIRYLRLKKLLNLLMIGWSRQVRALVCLSRPLMLLLLADVVITSICCLSWAIGLVSKL